MSTTSSVENTMRPKRIHPAGSAYRMGKYEILREPMRSEGGQATKRIWRVWEGELQIDGFPTLRDAVKAIQGWSESEKRDE